MGQGWGVQCSGDRDWGSESGAVSANTSVQGNCRWTSAVVTGYIKNKNSGIMIETFAELLKDENSNEHEMEKNVEDIQGFNDQTIISHVEYHAIRQDGLMESMQDNKETVIVRAGKSMVIAMMIDDPKSKLLSPNNPIIMLYNRSADPDETADYSYPDNKPLPPST